MSEYYLVHHGIKGQKWGQQNGPPYPLDSDDLSPAERRADTGEIKRVRRDDKGRIIKEDYNNMSDSDLRKTVERMELENRYLRAYDASQGKTFLEKTASTLQTVGSIMDSADKMSRFVTGKSFVQNLTDVLGKAAAKTGDDDIMKVLNNSSINNQSNNQSKNNQSNKQNRYPWGSGSGSSNKSGGNSFNADSFLNSIINPSSSGTQGSLIAKRVKERMDGGSKAGLYSNAELRDLVGRLGSIDYSKYNKKK